jgi:hypothetical protein
LLIEGTAGPSASPDFLSRLVALADFMRLSLRKAAHVVVGKCCVIGNPGPLGMTKGERLIRGELASG